MEKLFTPEQQKELASNPYTLTVTDRQIRFTVEFKRYLLNELSNPNMRQLQIFHNAGYDPALLGRGRIDAIIRRVRKEAVSEKGLHETAATDKHLKEDLTKKRMTTAIRDLQEEVIQLKQQIEFLKKIQILDMEDRAKQ